MVSSLNDVIAAIATPLGEGGIAVIRISGDNAIETADKGFKGRQKLTSAQTHTAHFGNFVDSNGEILDEVVATLFRAPHSYTAEDVIEISCHGGVYVTRQILQSIISYGARNAEPGEFTKRAFLNGRIDLAQAEAVADLIHARSEGAHRASIKLLGGGLSAIVKRIRDDLLRMCGLLELELDFAEEGIELAKRPGIIEKINAALFVIEGIQKSYTDGRMIRDGVKVALVGRPNAGKSSILNALLREERAIVTDIPGTTRDSISEELIINGIVFNLIDTAGLRDSESIVEIEGIKRTIKEVASADIVLLVIDISNETDTNNTGILDEVRRLLDGDGKKLITVYNKADLVPIDRYHLLPATQPHVIVSAKTGFGMENIGKKLSEFSAGWCRSYNQDGPVLTSSRHSEALKKAIEHLISAKHLILVGAGNEIVSLEVNASIRLVSEIIGVISTEDLLNSIFENFCIGK